MDGPRGNHGRRWIAAAVLGLTLIVCGSAAAAEAPTRDEYVAQLETICKPDAEATQKAMKGGRGDISAERLALAAAKFGKAKTIFAGTLRRMSAVSEPPEDAAKLAKWFTFLAKQKSYLGQITAQLKADRLIPAQRLTARFIHNGNLANSVVLAFSFNYCSFKFSRYG